ncbi:MAG: hypothetical protein J2P17_18625 [Mycobacterium sp.]|nr:hypothetical protein [Mycobacterium sp.]
MLNKTGAYTGLVIATAAGALLTSSPAYALDSLVNGGSWSSSHHRSHHRNRNWNGNHHHARIFIRIYIYNKNNNHAVAIARPERREDRPETLDGLAAGPGVATGLDAVRSARAVRAARPARVDRGVAGTGLTGIGNTGTENTVPAT